MSKKSIQQIAQRDLDNLLEEQNFQESQQRRAANAALLCSTLRVRTPIVRLERLPALNGQQIVTPIKIIKTEPQPSSTAATVVVDTTLEPTPGPSRDFYNPRHVAQAKRALSAHNKGPPKLLLIKEEPRPDYGDRKRRAPPSSFSSSSSSSSSATSFYSERSEPLDLSSGRQFLDRYAEEVPSPLYDEISSATEMSWSEMDSISGSKTASSSHSDFLRLRHIWKTHLEQDPNSSEDETNWSVSAGSAPNGEDHSKLYSDFKQAVMPCEDEVAEPSLPPGTVINYQPGRIQSRPIRISDASTPSTVAWPIARVTGIRRIGVIESDSESEFEGLLSPSYSFPSPPYSFDSTAELPVLQIHEFFDLDLISEASLDF